MTETRTACRSGVTHTPQGDCGGTPARRLRPRAGSAGRSRERKSMRLVEEVLRSDRPLVERDLVRVLVACGQGQPCVRRKSLARAHKETRTAGVMRMTLARGAGREEMPSRHSSHSLRLSATRRGCPPFVHAGSSVGRRFPSLRVRTVRKGAGPSDGVRLPTRSKPSKGVALVGMWTASESPSGGDDGSPETQRTPCPIPGCNRPGTYDAEETVEVVRCHRGGT
jgi:hypothetical protein